MSNEQNETAGGAVALLGLFEDVGFVGAEDGDGVDVLHGGSFLEVSDGCVEMGGSGSLREYPPKRR